MMGFLFRRARNSQDLTVSLSNREVLAPKPDLALRQAQGEVSRTVAPNCAIWNDIQRALEAK